MTARILIGLAGKAGAGKDTVADTLVQHAGFTRIAFAAPLKAMLRAGLGLTTEQLEDRILKEAPLDWLDGRTPRQLMQTLGTEWGRTHAHPDLWLRIARRQIEQTAGPIVITDVRFDNEARLVRDLGGLVWHITREGAGTAAHASEAGITASAADWWIANDGSIEDLQLQARALAGHLKNPMGYAQ